MAWWIVSGWLRGRSIEEVDVADIGDLRIDVSPFDGLIVRRRFVLDAAPGIRTTVGGGTLTIAPNASVERRGPEALVDPAAIRLSAPTTVRVRGGSSVTLVGVVDHLDLHVLDGAAVNAADLQVDRLTVTLEQSRATVRPARSVAGWVAYGATLTVQGACDTDELQTANAGRIVTDI